MLGLLLLDPCISQCSCLLCRLVNTRELTRWDYIWCPNMYMGASSTAMSLVAPRDARKLTLCDVQITRGLLQKYGAERVRDTPITEVTYLLPHHMSRTLLSHYYTC